MDRYIFHLQIWDYYRYGLLFLGYQFKNWIFKNPTSLQYSLSSILALFQAIKWWFSSIQFELQAFSFCQTAHISVTWHHSQIETSINCTKYKLRIPFSVKNFKYKKFTGFELSDWLKFEIGPASTTYWDLDAPALE